MPLPKAAPRKRIHTREIICEGFLRDDGLWDIEGSIKDSKTYSFDNRDRGGVAAGEPVHWMRARLTVDDDLVVQEAHVITEAGPHTICSDIAPSYEALKGLPIKAGWRKAVLEKVGGVAGCTHITDLLLGPLPVTAYQTVRRHLKGLPAKPRDPRIRSPVMNTCHALASDSPVAKLEWPNHYTGPREPGASPSK
jgi:hypothetical protein